MSYSDSPRLDHIPPVTVRRHRVDWETNSDLAEVTAQRVTSLGSKLESGCWYLNARFTVSAPAPTAEFFRKVIELRSSWLCTYRQSLSTPGQRREARRLQRQGRREALSGFPSTTVAGAQTQRPPEIISWTNFSKQERQEVNEGGRLAKQLGFSGVMFIDGELILPSTWHAMADDLLSRSNESDTVQNHR